MSKIKLVFCLTFVLICFFISSNKSNAAGPTYISYFVNSSDPWTKENSPYIVQNHTVVNVPLAIEAGTVVKFVSSLADLDIKKDFCVNGTREEPVVFTSYKDDDQGGDTNGDGAKTKPAIGDWSKIIFNPSQDKEFKIKYAKIFYASMGVSFHPSAGQTKEMVVKNSEIRKNGIGIFFGNAQALVESNIISENANYGISANVSTKTPGAVNNSITNNGNGARGVNGAFPGQTALEAKYNWWGDKTGPQNASNPDGKGNSVTGQASFDPWTREDPLTFPDPVIIIPGIMGSWEEDGEWEIDPIFHVYDDLRSAFLANGYEKEKNYFEFPYEWRDSNKVNAVELRAKIQEIKDETNRPKVDIVAHSMGGLLAREYIESSYYEDDVDQLITVGTPHLGAPKDYVTWEAGEFMGLMAPQMKQIFELEALKNGYSTIFNYIHERPMKSVQELLPVYNYLYDTNRDISNPRNSYPENYPKNEFLEELNSADKISKLENIEFIKIVGDTSNETSTVVGYDVVNSPISWLWKDGYPKNFYLPVLKREGILKSRGDGTVPLISAQASNIPANKTLFFSSEHNELPTDAQKDILEILTGKRPANEVRKWHIPDILMVLVHCPVDIQIISPSGEKIGKNFETGEKFDEIEGAYYTGFDTNTEFITIPNPEDGEYKIITQGTGAGEYEIEIVKVTENADDAEELELSITGTTEKDKIEEMKIKVEGMKVEKMTVPEPGNGNGTNSSAIDPVSTGVSTEVSTSPSGRIQTLDSLKGKIRQYFKEKKIKSRKEAGTITKKLNHIRVHLNKYEAEDSAKKQKRQKALANQHIDRLVSRINADFPKKITESARDYLTGVLEGLKME